MERPGDATATVVPVKPDPKPAAAKVSAPKQPTKEPEAKQPEAKEPPAKETLPTPRAEPAPARKKDECGKIAVGVCVAVVAIVIPLVCKLMQGEKEEEEEEEGAKVAKGGARVVVDKLVGWVKEIRGEEDDESKSEDYGEVSIPYEAVGTVEGFTNAQSL